MVPCNSWFPTNNSLIMVAGLRRPIVGRATSMCSPIHHPGIFFFNSHHESWVKWIFPPKMVTDHEFSGVKPPFLWVKPPFSWAKPCKTTRLVHQFSHVQRVNEGHRRCNGTPRGSPSRAWCDGRVASCGWTLGPSDFQSRQLDLWWRSSWLMVVDDYIWLSWLSTNDDDGYD